MSDERNTVLSYPRELRGPSQNRWGGHQARRLRGYPRQSRQTCPGRTLNREETASIEANLRVRGFLDPPND